MFHEDTRDVREIWREAIARIAERNDEQVSATIRAEIERIAGSVETKDTFSQRVVRAVLGRHPDEDIVLLTDYVVSLLWKKLNWGPSRKRKADDELGLVLGLEQLRTHLEARYSRESIEGLLQEQLADDYVGDLRCVLVRFGYSFAEIDRSLFKTEWEFLDSHGDDGSKGRKLLEENYQGGLPERLIFWAQELANSLAAGGCPCMHAAGTNQQLAGARTRCCSAHFLAQENLEKADQDFQKHRQREDGDDYKNNYSDPLLFVERAVTGNCPAAVMPRGFANSMFCVIYETPGGMSIRCVKKSFVDGDKIVEKEVLIEVGRFIPADVGKFADGSAPDDSDRDLRYPCFRCPRHDKVVDKELVESCIEGKHYWLVGFVDGPPDVSWTTFEVRVQGCQAGHVWPIRRGRKRCLFPGCELPPTTRQGNVIKGYRPRDDVLKDIVWTPRIEPT